MTISACIVRLLPMVLAVSACERAAVQEAKAIPPSSSDVEEMAQFRIGYAAARGKARAVFDKFLPLLGARPLLDAVEAMEPTCHAQAHDLGRAIYAKHKDIERALRECDTRCTSGCMHGVLAEAFGQSTQTEITARMNVFCAEGEMRSRHALGNCAHGIGHALMFVTSGDVRRALDECLGFDSRPMQYYCATGVWMEQVIDRGDSAIGLGSAACDAAELFPGACYRYKGLLLRKSLGSLAAVGTYCSALEGLQQRGCFHGLGYSAITDVYADPRSLGDICSGGDEGDRVTCIEGVIEKLAELHKGRAKAACAFLEDDRRPVCVEAVKRRMYSLDKSTFPLYYDGAAIARRRAQLAHRASRPGGPAHRH